MPSWQKSEGRRPPLHDEEYPCLQSLQLLNQVRTLGDAHKDGCQATNLDLAIVNLLTASQVAMGLRGLPPGVCFGQAACFGASHDDDLVIVSTTVYGTQDAPRGWYKNLDGTLLKKGLRRVRPGVDSC